MVEDEYLIRMLLEDMLADLGYTVAAAAGTHRRGARVAREAASSTSPSSTSISTASRSTPVADILAKRGLPFVFVTGYGEARPARALSRPPGAAEAVPGRRAGARPIARRHSLRRPR